MQFPFIFTYMYDFSLQLCNAIFEIWSIEERSNWTKAPVLLEVADFTLEKN